MKYFLLFTLIYINFNCCCAQKKIVENYKNIKIDYVDLYVMTPVNVTLENFYSYFDTSVKSITISDVQTVNKTIDELNKFFNSSEKAKLLPDTRLVITLYAGDKTQVITVGTTLLNVNNQSYIANDSIRQYFGKLTNNEW